MVKYSQLNTLKQGKNTMNNQSELKSGTNTITDNDTVDMKEDMAVAMAEATIDTIVDAIASKLNLVHKQGKLGWPVTFSYNEHTKPDEDGYLWIDKATFLEAGAGQFLTEVLEEAAQAKMDEEDTLESITCNRPPQYNSNL